MSKLSEALRVQHVFNEHELLDRFADVAGVQPIGVSFRRPLPRACDCSKTSVWSPRFETNPDARWYDHGKQVFIGNMAKSMPAALAWATETYGILDWSTSPFSRTDKVPTAILEAAKKWLKEQS